MDFELNHRFLFRFESKKGWTLMDIVFTSINSPVHKFGQGVLQDGLQTLLFDLVDMHRPSPNMEEDIEFQRVLNVKQILEKLSLRKLRSFSFVWTFETIAS
jgi:hypothetical protein